MTLDFNAVDPTVVPHFKGGAGEAHVRTAVADGMDPARGVLHRPAYPHWQL